MVKWKVWKHHAYNQLRGASGKDIFQTLSALLEFQPVNFEDGHNAFEVMQPTFDGLFQDFVMEIHSSMEKAGLLADREDTVVGMSALLQDMVNPDDKVSQNESLKGLANLAEESCLEVLIES